MLNFLLLCEQHIPLLMLNEGGGGGLSLKPPKFEHIFVAVITSPSFFCADTFDINLLFIVCALR